MYERLLDPTHFLRIIFNELQFSEFVLSCFCISARYLKTALFASWREVEKKSMHPFFSLALCDLYASSSFQTHSIHSCKDNNQLQVETMMIIVNSNIVSKP